MFGTCLKHEFRATRRQIVPLFIAMMAVGLGAGLVVALGGLFDVSRNDMLSAIKAEEGDVYIIGGAMFYRTMLPYCEEVLVTKVDADGEAEVFYENLDKLEDFECVYQSEGLETNGYNIKFTTYRNKNAKEF